MMDSQQVEMVVGDGREGYPDEGPYDAIHVGASAPHLPQALGKTETGGTLTSVAVPSFKDGSGCPAFVSFKGIVK
jgi:protein-L-isoaspartate O-methyltransferase